jgi:hypothetical protein
MADISEISGGEDGSYFDGCLLNTMEILVKDIEKRSGEKLKEPYIVYMIETRWGLNDCVYLFCCINLVHSHSCNAHHNGIAAWIIFDLAKKV